MINSLRRNAATGACIDGTRQSVAVEFLEGRDPLMDLNYLFRRQQQERFHAQWSTCTQAQSAHGQMAECYEKQISRLTDGRVTIQPLSTGTHIVADPQGE